MYLGKKRVHKHENQNNVLILRFSFLLVCFDLKKQSESLLNTLKEVSFLGSIPHPFS